MKFLDIFSAREIDKIRFFSGAGQTIKCVILVGPAVLSRSNELLGRAVEGLRRQPVRVKEVRARNERGAENGLAI